MRWILLFLSLPYCLGISFGPTRDGPDIFVCLEPRGQFRNPADCSTFYNCWDGNWYIQNCPQGLVFNEATRECDWPGTVEDCPGEGNQGTIWPTESARGEIITIKYTIVDQIHHTSPISITLHVPRLTNVYDIMMAAASENESFRFEADLIHQSHYVHKINGIQASDKNHHYWFLYRAKPISSQPIPAAEGPDDVYPENNEEVLFIFEQWCQ